jgi:hypothetical protein
MWVYDLCVQGDVMSDEEEEEEVISLPTDKYKPTSLEKMIALIASLVEKSRGEDQHLRLSVPDSTAVAGGKVRYIVLLQKQNNNTFLFAGISFPLSADKGCYQLTVHP